MKHIKLTIIANILLLLACGQERDPGLIEPYFFAGTQGGELIIELSAEPVQLIFTEDKSIQDIKLTNIGTIPVSWEMPGDTEDIWFEFSVQSGTVDVGKTNTVSVIAKADWGYSSGDGYIEFTREPYRVFVNYADKTIELSVKYINAKLEVSTNKLDFGITETELEFEISNPRNDELEWTIEENADWLILHKSSGTNDASIWATVNRDELDVGNYSSVLTVVSNVGSKTVNVSVQVVAGPAVSSSGVYNITEFSADVFGEIIQLGKTGKIIEHGHCWSITDNTPSTSDDKTTLGETQETGRYTSKISGLIDGATYYICAYVTDSEGTVYGNTEEFTTMYTNESLESYSGIPEFNKTNFFIEDFNNNDNGWPIKNEAYKYESIISNSEYYINVTSTQYMYSLWSDKTNEDFDLDSDKNFEIEISAKISYAANENHSGIAWGRSESSQFYYFGFTRNYHIIGYRTSSWNRWQPGTVGYINQSPQYNKLTIRKVGSMYYFFVNEQLVHTHSFKEFYGNMLAIYAGSQTTLIVDYLYIKYIK